MTIDQNPLKSKSFAFSLNIIQVYKDLTTLKREFVLSKQMLRSGTSIGANIKKHKMQKAKQISFIN